MLQRLRHMIRENLPHRPEYYRSALFRRLDPRRLERFLSDLGVREGQVLFVHVSLSALGYFPPGAAGLISLLRRLLGESGTMIMPSFPFTGSMMSYASTDPLFDLRHTPSRIGVVTEAFRSVPGAERSLHPSHPVCAAGRYAGDVVEGHDRCPSPCGSGSPFDRLIDMDAWILRLGTSVLTLGHWLQDHVRMPGIYLRESRAMRVIDGGGHLRWVETLVFRPAVPDIFILGRDSDDQRRTVRRRDYPFLFPGDREAALRGDPSRRDTLAELMDIREKSVTQGHYRWGRLGECPADCFSARAYQAGGGGMLARGLSEFADLYNPNRLTALRANGEYP